MTKVKTIAWYSYDDILRQGSKWHGETILGTFTIWPMTSNYIFYRYQVYLSTLEQEKNPIKTERTIDEAKKFCQDMLEIEIMKHIEE